MYYTDSIYFVLQILIIFFFRSETTDCTKSFLPQNTLFNNLHGCLSDFFIFIPKQFLYANRIHKRIDRQQIQLLFLEQMIHQHSFARIIDAFVDMLDLAPFNFKYLETKPEDRIQKQIKLPFNPADLLKLYLFGYQRGVHSCRKLEYACQTNIEVMWLLKGLQPKYKTIADFRKYNKKAFKKVFRHFVSILNEWELIEGKAIGINSFKIRAQNALKNNYNKPK